jgi:hypothetical protein
VINSSSSSFSFLHALQLIGDNIGWMMWDDIRKLDYGSAAIAAPKLDFQSPFAAIVWLRSTALAAWDIGLGIGPE